LTKTFLDLTSTDPISVATAFFHAMHDADIPLNMDTTDERDPTTPTLDNNSSPDSRLNLGTIDDAGSTQNDDTQNVADLPHSDRQHQFLAKFYHVLQFCSLCYKGKISPVLYTLDQSSNTSNWLSTLKSTLITLNRSTSKCTNSKCTSSDADDKVDSPDNKNSQKDQHFINTMLKLKERRKVVVKAIKKKSGFG
jgi:hypothetical protein